MTQAVEEDPSRELLTLSDFEAAARRGLGSDVWAYLAGGAGEGRSVEANIEAFESIWLRPRVPDADVVPVDTTVTVFGMPLLMPVLLAPTSPQRLLHEDAEIASAEAATRAGIATIVSTDSHYPFGEVAAVADGTCCFQLYPYRSLSDVDATVAMAEEEGAAAVVVTLDASHVARRVSARRAGFSSPSYVDFGTLRSLGVLAGPVPASARLDRLALTWKDVERIRGRTELPLVIKGVLGLPDALRCVDVGAAGIIVSNHGGRQLDSVIPSLVALSEIAPHVRDSCTVLVDGGIRSGVDVAKAMGLGAHAICIGRPYLWGLSVAGREGVEAVLALLRDEIEDTLRQLGIHSVSELGPECLAGADWSTQGPRLALRAGEA